MTPEQLKKKLESKYKFTVQPPFPPLDIRFEGDVIYNENDIVADYTIQEDISPKYFKMRLSNYRKFDQPLPTPYDNFEDIVIEIDNDQDFPIYVNNSNRQDKRIVRIKGFDKKLL